MSKENQRRKIKSVTAAAAAMLLAAVFSVPAGTEIMGVRLGNAVVAAAESMFTEDDLRCRDNSDGTVTVIGYSGSGGDVSIPRTIGSKVVAAIGESAFQSCTSLTSITIPDSVTSIGNFAFYASGIKSITFKEGSTLNTIGKNAFTRCKSLESIAIPEGVISIGDNALALCSSLETVTIPKSVTSIGSGVFHICSSITVDDSNPNYSSEEGVLFNKDKSELLAYPTKKSGDSYIIPDSVKSFAIGAFTDCSNLKSITIPSSVTSIEEYTFESCSSLTSVTIPSSVESIGDYAFYGCTSLASITIPNSVTSIGGDAFKRCTSLESITIPNSVTSIEKSTFGHCTSLASITIPNSVTSIGGDAFKLCTSLESITIPDSVNSIGEYAFSGCSSLTSVFIPENLIVSSNVGIRSSAAQVKYTVVDDGVFSITEVNLNGQTSVDFPDKIGGNDVTAVYVKEGTTGVDVPDTATRITYTVTDDKVTISGSAIGTEQISLTIPEKIGGKDVAAIGDSAFDDCTNLEKVTLPDSIISIGENAFIGCSSLGSITIPSSVTSIGTGALNCSSSITVDDSNPNYSSKDGVLFNKNGTTLITYPINKSGDSYIIPDGVKSIEDAAFLACNSLTSITIPDSVTSIGDEAFLNCSSLTSITIPDSVISVGEYAFMGCNSLESVFLPNDLSVINADIPASAAKVRYTVDNEGNVTITEVNLNDQTSVNFPDSIGGKPVASVCIKDGITGVNAPYSAAEVSYTVDDEGNVTITEVSLGDGQTSFDIPDTIGGKPVDIADGVLEACPDVPHTHREKTAATCTKKAVCSICGEEYDEVLGHDHSGDWQKNDTEHWRVCTRNGCDEILDKEAHSFDSGVITTQPTEETEGVKTYTCGTCGHTKTEPVAKLDHTHSLLADYSFDVSGHWHACSGCDEKVDFEAHTMDSGTITTVPTETTEGVKTYKCVKCGNVIRTETIPPIPPLHTHEYGTEWTSDSTSHWHECECGEKSDVSEHISDGGRVFTEPTDTADGVMVYSCTVCGHFIDAETIPALTPEHTHEYGTEWKSDSAYHWHECECGEKSDVSEHISDGGKITVQPTANTTGVKTYSCTVCGYVIGTETVPKTGSANGHWYPIYPTFPTTSTNPGYTVSQSVFTEKLTVTTATDGDMVILSWSKIGNADKYYVYQYKNGKYVSIKSTANNSVSLKGLKNGESYQFLVRYVVDGKLSPTTYSSKFTVKVCYKPMPKATAEKNSIKLSWKAVPGAEKYAVYKYVDGKAVKLAEIKGTSVRINKLSPDTEYSYIVSAYVDGEWTAIYKSDVVTVKTEAE